MRSLLRSDRKTITSLVVVLILTGLQFVVIHTISVEPIIPQLAQPIRIAERDPITGDIIWYNESTLTPSNAGAATTSSEDRWYAGSIPPWFVSKRGISIWTTIKTPATGESQPGYRYAALISCFDYPGLSYDQFGFYAYGSNYYVAWSYSTHDFWGFLTIHSHMGPRLLKNTYYTFEMNVDNDYLTYNMYLGGWLEWTKTIKTYGDWFLLDDWIWCGFILYASFTLFEEGFTPDAPENDLKFQNTQYILYGTGIWGYWDSWIEFYAERGYSVPDGVDVTINTAQHYVFIDNP
ncbi:MAG: hypothetical protein ACE5H4_10570 [Candidatus Thorarchaeota archaeon]